MKPRETHLKLMQGIFPSHGTAVCVMSDLDLMFL